MYRGRKLLEVAEDGMQIGAVGSHSFERVVAVIL
jgi:hypothetical protein